MDFMKLFETQEVLDERIVKEKGLWEKDLLPEKLLALRVELGEFTNELPEVFKFWSNKKNNYGLALKEYVDGLHFILSIGNDIGVDLNKLTVAAEEFGTAFRSSTSLINSVFTNISDFEINVYLDNEQGIKAEYESLFLRFLLMGAEFGFTNEQIETAYYDKNAINHTRQDNGY